MGWTYILTDNNFVPVGEIINADERNCACPLSKFTTASLKVRLDNPLANALLSMQGYIKAYRNRQLMHFGGILTAEEAADHNTATIMVNSVGAGWTLQKRLAGKSATGAVFSAATDRALIAKSLIDTANTESETHISTVGAISSASAVTYTAGPYKPVSDCITELATAFDGFDWYIDPIDNFSGGAVTGPKIASFRAAPTIGTLASEAIFEWGTGRNNIASYNRKLSRETQANKVYHNTSNGPDATGFPTISALDVQSITDWGLLEDLASADLLDTTMRTSLVSEHVRVRKNPRQIIEFTPITDPAGTRVPALGADYAIGDRVRARAVFGGVVRFDVYLRVYGVVFSVDKNGAETQTLTLVEEAA